MGNALRNALQMPFGNAIYYFCYLLAIWDREKDTILLKKQNHSAASVSQNIFLLPRSHPCHKSSQ